jgi:hypothetical protein
MLTSTSCGRNLPLAVNLSLEQCGQTLRPGSCDLLLKCRAFHGTPHLCETLGIWVFKSGILETEDPPEARVLGRKTDAPRQSV